jgi:hypothetical protein
LAQARDVIGEWRRDYNEVKPHSSCGRVPPAQFAARHRPQQGNNAVTFNPGLCQFSCWYGRWGQVTSNPQHKQHRQPSSRDCRFHTPQTLTLFHLLLLE